MFDVAWTEMLVIALITIVVVGPRDLPKVMKAIASFVAKVRSFSAKFQADMDALARETELEDLRKQARAYQATLQNPTRAIDQLIDPETGKEIRKPIDVSKLVTAGDGKSAGVPSLSEQAMVRAPSASEPAASDDMGADAMKDGEAGAGVSAQQAKAGTDGAMAHGSVVTPDAAGGPEELEDDAALDQIEPDDATKAEVSVSAASRDKGGDRRG